MNVIITQKNTEYPDFLKCNTLEAIQNTIGIIDSLVINKSKESVEDILRVLEKIRSRVKKLIYICPEKEMIMAIKMAVITQAGTIITDDFYLESNEDLLTLVNNIDEYSLVEEDGSITVLTDFINKFLQNNQTSFTPVYIQNVKISVQNLIKQINRKDLEMVSMSETATQLFNNLDTIISGISEDRQTLNNLVNNLKEKLEERDLDIKEMERGYSRASSMVYFNPVTYPKEKNILRIKEIGNVRYLMSFVLGLRMYFETIVNVRPKLIIAMPIGDEYLDTFYKEYKWITQYTLRDRGLYYNNIVFTNCPNKDVLTLLLEDNDYDYFILVDRLKNSEKCVLNAKGPLWYAIQSEGLLGRINTKLQSRVFFTSCDDMKNQKFCIKGSNDYPTDKADRERFYLSSFSKEYDLFAKLS